MRDYVRACGAFYDAVKDHRVAHLDDWRLNDAVRSASRRALGQAWAWDRRGSSSIAPLVAATLATWVASTDDTGGAVTIY